MYLKSPSITAWALCLVPCLGSSTPRVGSAEAAFDQTLAAYQATMDQLLANASSDGCNAESVAIRRSWDDLSDTERLEYIQAVKCLNELPAVVDKSLAPGAATRADDFTYSHINQTNFVHGSGIFLPWHRQFIWAYEKALRDECGYDGYLPYWDWLKHSEDQAASPVFSGGNTGFGGNGVYVPHGDTNDSLPGVPGPTYIDREAGTGGGCITDGAFADLVIHLGPVCPADTPADDPYGLQSNPRCLVRDFAQPQSSEFLNYEAAQQLMASPDYAAFRTQIDLGIHPAAHKYIGGDLYDFYTSPSDPVFFLLHSQVDRLWALWQGQDYAARKDQVGGTVTFRNLPPSENATLSSVLRFDQSVGEDVTFKDTVSSVENAFCYVYA